MNDADTIREYANVVFIKPARKRGENQISFSAKEIHAGIGFVKQNFPNICNSICGNKFQELANVELVLRTEPCPSSTTVFTFRLL